MQQLVTALLLGFLAISQVVTSQKHVIVAVGSTGMGKSTMAKYLTGSDKVVVGHTHKSETRDTSMHESDKFIFIDTPGFDDSEPEQFPDKKVKVQILQFLHDKNMTSFNTIMWFCNPNVRSDAKLKQQAGFIESFQEKGSPNSIWKNVIIIIKAGEDSKGPLGTINGKFKPEARSLYIMDENEKYKKHGKLLGDENRIDDGYLNGSELQGWIKQWIDKEGHSKNPYKMTFYNDHCRKCGLQDDHRLMGNQPCHDVLTKVHKGKPETVHSGHLERYHPGYLREKGDPWINIIPIAGPLIYMATKGTVYTCCGGDTWSGGCTKKYSCCGRSEGQVGCTSHYSECHCSRDAEGCTSVCRNCNRKHGTAGCGTSYEHDIEYSIEARKKLREEL